MTVLAVPGVAYARAEWSRWVADCPAPYCRSALQLQRWDPLFQCWECGARAEIVWPPFAHDVERLLMMRPDPTSRNWMPGEDLHDLLLENLAHGILPAPAEELAAFGAAGGGRLLEIVEDRIVYDPLAVTAAPQRPGIGGQ